MLWKCIYSDIVVKKTERLFLYIFSCYFYKHFFSVYEHTTQTGSSVTRQTECFMCAYVTVQTDYLLTKNNKIFFYMIFFEFV